MCHCQYLLGLAAIPIQALLDMDQLTVRANLIIAGDQEDYSCLAED